MELPHIINDEKYFISFDERYVPEKHFIELADGSRSNNVAKKRGTAVVGIKDENGITRKAKLKNALFVPSYPQKIFSVQAATETGAEIHFDSNKAELLKDGVRFPIQKQGRLYYLYKCAMPADKNVKKVPRSCNLEAWHKILGHCNKSDVINSEKVVRGMKITSKDIFNCTACILGKQTTFRNKNSDERATAAMELIHSDLSGAVDPISKDGYKYAMTFVDDYSSVIFVYFIKQKCDAVDTLKKFLADSAPHGKIKRMRSDNGGEYIASAFESVLTENQIKVELTCPYSPHQNGTAERSWQTLFNMGRTLLLESKLPKYFWTYAVMAAAFIRNRCFNQRIKETPQFLMTGVRPDISKLHVFGTICYPYIEQYKKKLDARAYEGIFVGYDKYSPSYLVYNPKSNTVNKHRVVKFTESFVKTKEQKIPVSNAYDKLEEIDYTEEIKPIETDIMIPDVTTVKNHDDNFDDDGAINNVEINHQTTIDTTVRVDNNQENDRRNLTRLRKEPGYMKDYVCHVDCLYKIRDVPKSYEEAVNSDDSHEWKDAMKSEMSSLVENNTFTVVQLPNNRKTVGGRWVFSLKTDPNGSTVHKARYVAKGYSQQHGLDYFDTFSPTAKMSSIRLMMQIAAENGLVIHQLDVRTAFLNAPIDCEIFVQQPKGFENTTNNNDQKLVWRLHKSLYGLKQSGRNWNTMLHKVFEEKKFQQSAVDPCVYFKCEPLWYMLYSG